MEGYYFERCICYPTQILKKSFFLIFLHLDSHLKSNGCIFRLCCLNFYIIIKVFVFTDLWIPIWAMQPIVSYAFPLSLDDVGDWYGDNWKYHFGWGENEGKEGGLFTGVDIVLWFNSYINLRIKYIMYVMEHCKW